MTFYHCLLILDRAKAYIKVQGDASYDCHIPSQDPIYSSIAGDISLQNPLWPATAQNLLQDIWSMHLKKIH